MKTKNIRFGIIGTNDISDKVIAGGRMDSRFNLTAVYSRTKEQADWFAQKHDIPHTFASLEEMLESSQVDAVYVASPNSFHAEQSILCMQHGKHVLCEKAFASNAREVNRMICIARDNNVVLMEAMKSTLTPNFKAVQEHIKEIGTVRRYFSAYCQYSSRYDKYKEGIVLNAFKTELSNGALPDIGVYTIYPMVVLFGRPDTIQATGLKMETGVDSQGSVAFSYKGMTANVIYSKIADSFLPTEIQGEAGTIILDRINIINDACIRYRNGETNSLVRPHCGEEYFYEVREFIDLIVSGRKESAVNSHENSLITMEVMDEIRRQTGVVYPADNY